MSVQEIIDGISLIVEEENGELIINYPEIEVMMNELFLTDNQAEKIIETISSIHDKYIGHNASSLKKFIEQELYLYYLQFLFEDFEEVILNLNDNRFNGNQRSRYELIKNDFRRVLNPYKAKCKQDKKITRLKRLERLEKILGVKV